MELERKKERKMDRLVRKSWSLNEVLKMELERKKERKMDRLVRKID